MAGSRTRMHEHYVRNSGANSSEPFAEMAGSRTQMYEQSRPASRSVVASNYGRTVSSVSTSLSAGIFTLS